MFLHKHKIQETTQLDERFYNKIDHEAFWISTIIMFYLQFKIFLLRIVRLMTLLWTLKGTVSMKWR